jgi:cytochrome P450
MLRATSPLFRVPPPFDGWMVLDYESAKRVLTDHETFSSEVPSPPNFFIFYDPPAHTKLRALIARAFTPRTISDLEPQIRAISTGLLDDVMDRQEMDFATEFSVPLSLKVISGMIGIPVEDSATYRRWSDGILGLSYTLSAGQHIDDVLRDYAAITDEMNAHIQQRRRQPEDDLLTRLMQAEIDGEKLTDGEILGFFQLLVAAGQETTSDLINNALLCFIENPDQLAKLRNTPELLGSAIEEVLRYRSPVQWTRRTPRHEVEIHGTKISAGDLVLAMQGSANRDPRVFADANQFDITRNPNPHISFGHGIHFCLGAALSRLEARIGLSNVLQRFEHFELASDAPWEPREPLAVHGPNNLPIRFAVNRSIRLSA